MPDLRDDLDRLAGHAGEPVSFEDLSSARRRRERRRRAEGLVVGLAVIVAAAVFLATTFRSSPSSNVPGGTPPATAYVPPEAPYLWPENWVFSSDTPADVQAKVDAGDPDLQWQTDPQQVVERFAAEVLGWDGIAVDKQFSDAGVEVWRFGASCVDPSRCPVGAEESVVLGQPATTGTGGIWEVQRVVASDLALRTQSQDQNKMSLEPGATLRVDSSLPGAPGVAAGTSATNGCIKLGGTPTIGQVASFSVNGVGGSVDREGNCGSQFAAMAYVYAVVDGEPGGFPLNETAPMQALTMLPFVVDASVVPPSGGVDQTACLAAPAADITIIGKDVSLSGCTNWAANEPLSITLENQDAIPMGLALWDAARCDETGCHGDPIWQSSLVQNGTMTNEEPALEPGQYVLLDPVHPVSARLEISVGAY